MTSRVLVADDSLTIQKVIGITLSNSGYELVECLNEADLNLKIKSNKFDLVLLDFNLSDSHSGYELAKQISASIPDVAIIVMLGTFDTVDESKFDACGITDKIVKPFESTKFIKKCRDLLEGNRPVSSDKSKSVEQGSSESPKENKNENSNNLDLWKVDAPQMLSNINEHENEENYKNESNDKVALDPLSSEIAGWGFTAANSLEEKFQKVFPPIVEESSGLNILDGLQSTLEFVNTFDLEKENPIESDATDPLFIIPEDLNRNLLSEIEDDVSADAFWAVDEIVPKNSVDNFDISETHLDQMAADISKPQKINLSSNMIDQDEIVEKLKISLRPMIEEMVKEFCRQTAEKVAWEVIPDLAENLIRKEIKEISESVQH